MPERRRLRRADALRAASVSAIVSAILLVAPPADALLSGARLSASVTAPRAYATDTLDPPTSLAATGGKTAKLTWTTTVDTYASGYQVLRSTTSGSGYAQVATATPRSAATVTDSPTVDGTYFYVLRSFLSNWTSTQTSQVSAVVRMGVTGFLPCTAQAADAGGDANGYETTPGNACAVDGAVAVDVDSGSNTTTTCTNVGKDTHRFTSFGISLPAAVASIDGITVRIKARADAVPATTRICAQLSWNNGTTYTATQQVDLTSTALTTYTLGGTAVTWGRTWAVGDLSNANFRVRLVDVASVATRDFSLDSVEVQVNYTP